MKTSRRKFIKQTLLGTSGTLLVPHFLKALESQPSGPLPSSEKILVVIQLSGGNDGLNTIIPYQNDLYYQLRPQLAIRPDKILKISNELGFHSALTSLRELFDEGSMAILNNVGYPNPDRSHFRSMDIWHSASDANTYMTTGWIGRYLDSNCSSCHSAHQAIEVDDTLSMALKGKSIKGLAMKNPQKLYQATHNNFFEAISKQNVVHPEADSTLHYLYKTMAEAVSSAEFIYEKSQVQQSKVEYPQNEFSKRLKTVAELIHANINTRVYYLSLSGFDTHTNQEAQQQRLLRTYADGVRAFVKDIGDTRMKDVVIMTFSEFGRRVAENGSGGTDHGTANNVFIISNSLKKKGFLNNTPDLSRLDQGDLIHQLDFRSIYATLLNKWLEVPSEKILNGPFPPLDFI
jgi:uncharacterized protein (DUF1501 family)